MLANKKTFQKDILNKKVLVTGGGGSIGQELCRQIAKQKPKLLIILEQNEFSLYKIFNEFYMSHFNVYGHTDKKAHAISSFRVTAISSD